MLAARGTAPCVLEQFRGRSWTSSLDGKSVSRKGACPVQAARSCASTGAGSREKGALTNVIVSDPERGPPRARRLHADRSGRLERPSGHRAAVRPSATPPSCANPCRRWPNSAVHRFTRSISTRKPVSMQLVVRAGGAAFTWKTAYDEELPRLFAGNAAARGLHDGIPGGQHDRATSIPARTTTTATCRCGASRQAIADIWIDAGAAVRWRSAF